QNWPPPGVFAKVLRTALVILCFVFITSICWAYDLYVSTDVDTTIVVPDSLQGTIQYPYRNIQDAINHAFDYAINPSLSIVTINVGDGIYEENLVIDFFDGATATCFVSSLSLRSTSNDYSSCLIMGADNTYATIDVRGFIISKLSISGFSIKNANNSHGVYFSSFALQQVDIADCLFEQCNSGAIFCNENYQTLLTNIERCRFITQQTGSLSIQLSMFEYSGSSHVNVNSCKFIGAGDHLIYLLEFYYNPNVTISNSEFVNVFLVFQSTIETSNIQVIVQDNKFQNSSIESFRTNISITGNVFEGVRYFNVSEIIRSAAIHLATNTSFERKEAIIERNLFLNCPTVISIQTRTPISLKLQQRIVNNTFVNCPVLMHIPRNQNNDALYSQNLLELFQNNICTGNLSTPFVIRNLNGVLCDLPESSRFVVDYCLFTNDLLPANSYVLGNCIISVDPLIELENTNNSYLLTWTDTQKSPCINTGYPGEDNELTDPDGTPPDIGAIYYPHVHKIYDFSRAQVPGSSIFWMSFPVVDDRTHTDRYWNELGYLFKEHMVNTPDENQLSSASWSYNPGSGNMEYDYLQNEWPLSDYLATQAKGFKIKFNDNGGQTYPIVVNGFKASAATTPVELKKEYNSSDFDNWIGYFVPYTQGTGDAFSRLIPGSNRVTYLDHIYSIKTQTWSTNRINAEYGSPWISNPNRYTLREGDMVAVKLLRNAPDEMYWTTFTQASPSRLKEISQSFSYTEELDYTPVFIELDPNDLPNEVGIYVGGECKGAAVVDSSLIEVNYYASEAKSDDELQIMFYYEGKGIKSAPDMLVYNKDSLLFETGKLKASQLGDYGYISFNRQGNTSLVPLVTELKQNYPNPFRAETKIAWVLENDTPVSIDVYNLKGQKVKTLFMGTGKKGKQNIGWDATDSSDQRVASGVYLYRLSTPSGNKVHKMLVLK
ncbi:MAG: T9SS type A sorting domain-containing protein, partial [Candidatus Cloacimonas sp.]|nr:T9SS type A sorting domain-containing protein [Candidatus Cloacimonas sp.]